MRRRWIAVVGCVPTESLEDLLNIMRTARRGSDPNYEYTLAKEAVAELGGEIVRYDMPGPEDFDETLIY